MILSAHAIFGSAIASLVPTNPALGFTLAFVSHLALDTIPHRDYDLASIEADPQKKTFKLNKSEKLKIQLSRDIFFVSIDAILGIFLSYLLFFDSNYPLIFLVGSIGSMLPDFLTFLSLILKNKFLNLFFRFHSKFLHSQIILKLSQLTGIILQFLTITIFLLIIFGLKILI